MRDRTEQITGCNRLQCYNYLSIWHHKLLKKIHYCDTINMFVFKLNLLFYTRQDVFQIMTKISISNLVSIIEKKNEIHIMSTICSWISGTTIYNQIQFKFENEGHTLATNSTKRLAYRTGRWLNHIKS